MNFKKFFTSLFLFSSLVISCGSKTSEDKIQTEGLKASISVQAEEAWVPYYEAAIARVMEKNPEANIELKVVGSFDHIEALEKTDASNEDIADVFSVPLDRIEGLYTKDIIASFDAKALANSVGGFDNYDEGLGGQLKFDGNYVGFPQNIETLFLGVNTKNAQVENVNLEDIDFAKLPANVAMMPVFDLWWGVAINNAFGVNLLSKDGDKFSSDLVKDWSELTPEVQLMFEGLYNYWKSANENKIPLFDKTAAYGFMDSNFKTGSKGSVRISGPWEVGSWTNLVGDNLEVLSLNKAKFEGKELKHWKGGWALVINSRYEEDQEKLALSEVLIAELMNPKYAKEFYEATNKIMPNVSKEEYSNLGLNELDKKVIISVIESYETSESRPLFKEWGQVWGTWESAILSWEAKKPANAEEAYKEIQASFKSLLTNLQ